MAQLLRADIVGRRIASVFSSEEIDCGEGVFVSTAYVQLDNGVAFELSSQDPDDRPPIVAVDLAALRHPVQDCGIGRGEIIREVVSSVYWPTIGLIVESGHFVFCSDCNTPWHVGPCCLRIGERYDVADVEPYWT